MALGLAAAFALGAGEAAAQDSRVCDNAYSVLPAGTTEERVRELSGLLRQGAIAESPHVSIYCRYGRADRRNRGFLVHNPQIVVVDDFVPGIEAFHEGVGDLGIYVQAVSGEPGSAGDFIHPSPVDYGQGIFTTGKAEDYITGDDSYGIHARHTGAGRAGIDVRNVSVRTTGDYAHGVYAWQQGSYILVRRGEDGSDEVVSGYVWDEDAGFFRRNDEDCPDCRSVRARGAVIVNLIETDRERDQRVRPLVATSGDYADAVRAEYTRAAARGHIAVTVEGYTLATGGIVPEEAIVSGVEPEEAIEVSTPRSQVYDPSKVSIVNPNHDPLDPDSPEFINVVLRDDGSLATDLRPYTAVYIPVRNTYYDPDDPDSSPWDSGIALWNGRYFLALGKITADYVNACQGEATADARRACYENKIVEDSGANLPTGFNARGIYASHEGHGDIRIRATDNGIRTSGADAQGIYATHTGRTIVCGAPGSGCEAGGGTTPGGGGISIVVTGGAISTRGEDSHGVWARHRGDSGADDDDGTVDPDDIGTGNVDIAVTDADIGTTGDHARGVYGLIQQTCTADTAEGCKEAENLIAGTGVGDIDIAVTGGSITTAGVDGAYAVHARHENTGAIAVRLTGVDVDTTGAEVHGVFAEHRGSEGAVSVTVEGGSVATQGADAHGVYGTHAGRGALTVAVTNGAKVTTKGIGAQGVRADLAGDGSLTVNLAGDVTTEGEGSEGALALHRGSGNLAIGMTSGTVKTTGFEAHGLYASHTGAAARTVTVTVSGGSVVTAEGSGSAGVLAHHGASDRDGALMVTVGRGAKVTGGLVGIQLIADADAGGNVPTSTVNVDGTVRGVSSAGIYLLTGGVVNVGATGHVSGGAAGIFSDGDYDTDVTVAGTVEDDVRAEGDGDLTVTVADGGEVKADIRHDGGGALTFSSEAGSTVTGTVHDPAGELTVHGNVGRLLYGSGGTVTVAGTGRLTGVEVDGRREALRSTAGDLTVTVAGGGEVKADIRAGGDGDVDVTVAGTVEGDVHAGGDGDLTVTVADGGEVKADIRHDGGGALTFSSEAGSTVTGTVHDPASPLTVHGSVGRLLYGNDGTVTVAGTGRLTGVEVDGRREALRSTAGDLTVTVAGGGEVKADIRHDGSGDLEATISGAVQGDVLGLGTGDHVVTVREGGTVAGTIRLAASTVTVDGAAGRVWVENGGAVTVGSTGRLTGVEVDGRREAIRSDTGNLTASLAGRLMGDVLALGTGAHRVTVEEGGDVSGTVRVATPTRRDGTGSALRVNGAVGHVHLDRGGAFTVGSKGRIRGIDGIAVSSPGDIEVAVEHGPGETAADALRRAVNGRIASGGESRLLIQPEGEPESARPLGRLHTADAIPSGAFDLGLAGDGEGGFLVRRDIAPRARLYEALPSMMLGMNELPGFQDRMAAPRSANGGGTWARVDAVGGQWKADASSTQALSQAEAGLGIGLEYDYRRHGIQAGFDLPWGEEVLLGFSLHHRRGSAEVREGGDVEPSGMGLGFSGVWLRNDDLYVDLQAEATWYTTDLTSSIRGPMKHDLRGFGHALGVEAGRRVASGMDGVAFIPRAGLVHSKVSVSDFTDTVDSHVSLKGQRSLKGRIGVGVEKTLDGSPESRLLGSLDVEREFKDEAKVVVSGTELNSTAKATRLRLGLDGVHAWADGRYTLQGGVGYERGGGDNYELGGRLGLEVRF